MDNEFWINKWRTGEIGFHEDRPHPLLLSCWSLVARGAKRVLVPLCGKSLDMRALIESGFHMTGVEVAREACEAFFEEAGWSADSALTSYGERFSHEGVDLINGDWFEISPGVVQDIDAVYDRAALIAVPPERRGEYVEQLQRLAPGAPILLITLKPVDGLDGPPFGMTEEEVRALFPDYRITLLAERGSEAKGIAVTEQAYSIF